MITFVSSALALVGMFGLFVSGYGARMSEVNGSKPTAKSACWAAFSGICLVFIALALIAS